MPDHTVLQDTAERYRLLVDSITDYAIYMLDADGRVVSWNPGAQRFKGYAPAEIIGEHFSRFYTPEDRAAGVPARALATARNEGRFEAEGWRVRKSGDRFWAHVVIDPIRDSSGALVGYAKITRDLTERRMAEEAVRKSEQLFKLLVQGVTDYAIYLLDREGHVSSWNAGARRIKGYEQDEIIGEHFSRFYTEEDRAQDAPRKALATAAAEGRFEKEGWRVRKNGERFFAHVVIDPIRDGSGAIIGFAKITRDITERREAQERLDEARQALLQAQKLDAIGQLTGGIAHDFNNLLMAIIGSLELLRTRLPPDPRLRQLAENALTGAHRGANLTQRLLAFARKQDLKLEAVEVRSTVQGLAGMLQRLLGPSIELKSSLPRDLPCALTDATQLEAALVNLIINARDALPQGGEIAIEASVQPVGAFSPLALEPGDYIRISVIDDGEGMDAQTLQRASEPFFTTKGVGKGTGLGLSTVHGLAEQSGGRLALQSTPGKGTRVDIWLPVTQAAAAAEAEHHRPVQSRSLAVLAVDDDDLVLTNTAAMLEELGHQVTTAGSGAEALAKMQTETFDLVVTDYAMPRMSGVELAEQLRQGRQSPPILIVSGFADAEVGLTYPLLNKPHSLEELADAIEKLIA